MNYACHLSDLYCPIQPSIHRYVEEVEHDAIMWAWNHGLIDSSGAEAKMRFLKMGTLAARTHPDTSAEALRLMAHWCLWFFKHDDICDSETEDLHVLRSLHEELSDVIDQRRKPRSILATALHDLWVRTIQNAPSLWIQRCSRNFKAFFESKIWEAEQRCWQKVPEPDTYIMQRPITSGMHVYIDLLEVSHQVWLPATAWQAIYTHRILTARACCWANDIVSFEREQSEGEVLNLVIVLMTCGFDEEAAMQQAIKLHNDDIRALEQATESLGAITRSWDSAIQQAIENSIVYLGMYIRGNLDWSTETARYLPLLQRERSA